MRRQQENIVKDNIVCEYLPFLFTDNDGTTVKSTACITVKDVQGKIEQQIDGYEK